MIINVAPNRRILNYGYIEQFKDVFKNIIPAIIMGACVYPLSLLTMSPFVLMVVQIALSIIIYLALSAVTKNESFRFVASYIKKFISSRKKA